MILSSYFAGHRYEFSSAKHAAEKTLDAMRAFFSIESALDIGSGPGVWMSTWKKHGVKKVFGLDNDKIQPGLWLIEATEYKKIDLTKPVDLGEKFDVAVSLEVAEHISEEYSDVFIQNITKHADVVLFSAAVPQQGGTNHLNEQWPEYWAEKFALLGYDTLDFLRDRLWTDAKCPVWYVQNMLVFVKSDLVDADPNLSRIREQTNRRPLARVHPRVFDWFKQAQSMPVQAVTHQLQLGADVANLNLISKAPAQLLLSERLMLYSFVRGLQPKRVLEIGTAQGGATMIIKQALTDAGCYSTSITMIDPQIAPNTMTDATRNFLFHADVPMQWDVPCNLIEGYSPDALEGLEGVFDLIIVDGDHSYEGVRKDLEALVPYLAADGYLLAHDAHYGEISRAIDEVLALGLYHDAGLISRQPYQNNTNDDAVKWCGMYLMRPVPECSDT